MADALTRFSLVQAGDRVLCALSGGGDSVCLTHVLAHLAQREGLTLAAAHLRGHSFFKALHPYKGKRLRYPAVDFFFFND